jgi:uncharacterized phage-associated protein
MKTYDSILIAKYLLSFASSKQINLNVTKVQKLLYIIYGYYLAEFNGHRIIEERPKAWPFGPVFPRAQKKVDYSKITPINSKEFEEIEEDSKLVDIIIRVIDKYAKYSASRLSEWSHAVNGPWDRTTQQDNFKWNTDIPDEYISAYFKSISVL